MNFKKTILKIIPIFSLFVLVMSFFAPKASAALYNEDRNRVTTYEVNRSDNKLTFSIEYQFGFENLKIYICDKNTSSFACINDRAGYISYFIDRNGEKVVNTSNKDEVKTYNATIVNPRDGKLLNEYPNKYDSEGKMDNNYLIVFTARFCTARNEELNDCISYATTESAVFYEDTFNMETGLTNSAIINDTVGEVLNIINNIVIPILWVLLGVLLIVRGIMLSIDIVKSSDEPEVRKRKISGLIWLTIGVFLGYVVTITAKVVMGMFGYGGLF